MPEPTNPAITPKGITVDDLTRAAVTYQPYLTKIPVLTIAEVAQALKFNMVNLKESFRYLTFERRGARLTPYRLGQELISRGEAGKVKEMPLNMCISYIETIDDITKYDYDDKKKVIVNGGQPVDLVAGTHPLAAQIVFAEAATLAEDVIAGLFFNEFDEDSNAPSAAFDGFYPIITALKTAGAISADEKNLKESGTIAAPADPADTLAYDHLVEWLRQAPGKLLRGKRCILRLSSETLLNVRNAYANKVNGFKDPTIAEVVEQLKAAVLAPGLEVAHHYCLGTGGQLLLTGEVDDPRERDLLSFGINTEVSESLVKIRTPFRNPNQVQFFTQAAFGTCIKSVNPNLFMTNEQENTAATNISGDYEEESE